MGRLQSERHPDYLLVKGKEDAQIRAGEKHASTPPEAVEKVPAEYLPANNSACRSGGVTEPPRYIPLQHEDPGQDTRQISRRWRSEYLDRGAGDNTNEVPPLL